MNRLLAYFGNILSLNLTKNLQVTIGVKSRMRHNNAENVRLRYLQVSINWFQEQKHNPIIRYLTVLEDISNGDKSRI